MSYVAIWLQACLHWGCAYFQTLSRNDTIFVVDWDILYKLCGSANKWSKGFVFSSKIWWQFFSCHKACSKYNTRSTITPKYTLPQRLVLYRSSTSLVPAWETLEPGGCTPLYKLYRYVSPHRVGFCAVVVWKRVYTLPSLVWNRVCFLRELRDCMNVLSRTGLHTPTKNSQDYPLPSPPPKPEKLKIGKWAHHNAHHFIWPDVFFSHVLFTSYSSLQAMTVLSSYELREEQ